MNGAIFKVFGVAILAFNFFLVVMFALAVPGISMSAENMVRGQILFLGFLLISSLIAFGLIYLHRWAAITASLIGLVWSLAVAAVTGYATWKALFIGGPIAFGLLLPLYATIRNWSSLRPIKTPALNCFVRVLRSLDPLHLE